MKNAALRRPWPVLAISLIGTPTIGALYLGRARLALQYFLISNLALLLPFVIAHFGGFDFDPQKAVLPISIACVFLGSIHCLNLAKAGNYPQPLKGYAKGPWVLSYFLAAMLIPALVRYFYEPYGIPSEAMNPTLLGGDHFIGDNRAYRYDGPARGDIILFDFEEMIHIKRVVGVPGDVVEIHPSGALVVNGLELGHARASDFDLRRYVETLPGGRHYEILDADEGTNVEPATYEVPEDHYFVLGDHRDDSRDSRDDTMGFVAKDQIRGKALFTYWRAHDRKFQYRPL